MTTWPFHYLDDLPSAGGRSHGLCRGHLNLMSPAGVEKSVYGAWDNPVDHGILRVSVIDSVAVNNVDIRPNSL